MDFLVGQAESDKVVATELSQGDISIDGGGPGLPKAMKFEHHGDSRGLESRTPITPPLDGISQAARAVLANLPIVKKSSRRTKQTVVVQGLHHRYSRRLARIVCRRTDLRQKIMAVDDVRPFFLNERADCRIRSSVPRRGHEQSSFLER